MTYNDCYPGNFIDPTAAIAPGVIIGIGNIIGPFCVIGYPAEWKGKESYLGRVTIGNNNRITGLVTIDSGVESDTKISNDCYLMKHSHCGHDSVIEDGVTISCGAKIGGHAVIGAGSTLGLNSVIHQKCIVPEGCMIGALAFVGKKTEMKPFSKYAGVPAKYLGSNESSVHIHKPE